MDLPSANETLADCVAIVPAFGDYWTENSWYFEGEEGTYAACGVFLLLTWFLYERHSHVAEAQWRELAALTRTYFDRGEPTRGMIGACWIEPLESSKVDALVLQYFDREMLRYFQYYGA